jgi:oligosaccharide repeat unit polymerase
VLLNVKTSSEKEIDFPETRYIKADPPWWVNPALYFIFFLTPFFAMTVLVSEPYMDDLGQKVNNINFANIMVAVLSIAMLTAGASVFSFSKNHKSAPAVYKQASIEKALLIMGLTSLVSNLIYFLPLALKPGPIFSFLSGNVHAMYEIRNTLGKIPGVTSFMVACMPFFSLYSFITVPHSRYSLPPLCKKLFFILLFFVVVRAILGSERLALVIAIVAYMIPRVVFSWKPSPLRFYAPFIGVFGVFGLFAAGEYFRSWQYYKAFFGNFWEFITIRFLGYFSTSINNGAGIITHYDPVGYPFYTAEWFNKLLRIFHIDLGADPTIVGDYLNRYATPEFNNPGGLYIPYMDYGLVGGMIFFFFAGLLVGWLFRKFIKAEPIGILLFPYWFIGCLDIIRILAWTGSGSVPVVGIALMATFILQVKRDPIAPLG